MTEQTINASVLAEYLDVLKQMQASLAEIKKPSGNSIQEIAWTVHNDSGSMIRHLDALRALVAEQEQARADEPDEVDLAVKAAFERRMHAHSTNVPCEEKDCALCKKRAAEQLGDSPQFAVGDTVRVKHGYSFHRFDGIVGLEGVVKETGITIEAIDPFRNDGLMIYIEFCNPQEQMMYPQDLTLIAKGQA